MKHFISWQKDARFAESMPIDIIMRVCCMKQWLALLPFNSDSLTFFMHSLTSVPVKTKTKNKL